MSHNKLLTVVEIACVQNSVALEWFRSYLVGCHQHVRTSSSTSAPAFIMCGVPQWSALGHILFLLYTDDLLSLSERHGFILHLYADDTQILGSCQPSASQDLLTLMSACIEEVAAWMRSNRLQLNTAKTKFFWSTTSRVFISCCSYRSGSVPTTFHQLPLFETLEFTSTAMSR